MELPHIKSVRPTPIFSPSSDTIYHYDTIYQYVIIYDTVFYDEISTEIDTLAVFDTLVNNTDSAIVVNNRVMLNINEKKTIYLIQKRNQSEKQKREFSELPQSNIPDQPTDFNFPEQKKTDTKRKVFVPPEQSANNLPLQNQRVFPISRRDTIVIYDTIIHRIIQYDTVFFENSKSNRDTTILHYTDFEKSGNRVVANQTVEYTVKWHESSFVDRSSFPKEQPNVAVAGPRPAKARGTPISISDIRKRKESGFASRQIPEKNVEYAAMINGGFSVYSPSVFFLPKQKENETYTDFLNDNTQNMASWGLTLTYSYFRNGVGIETGAGLSKTNFRFDHKYSDAEIDTTFTWQYFQSNLYEYDTTWYINIDTLLQTGDTLFIPNVDSTLFVVTDSIQKTSLDTTMMAKAASYYFSYSYLEIPLNARFRLFNGKLSAFLVTGVVPSFLISKSGILPGFEAGVTSETEEVKYDFGFNLSGYGAISLHYKFHDDFSVFAEPFIRRNLITTMMNDRFIFQNNSWGIKFGLSYTLFSTKRTIYR